MRKSKITAYSAQQSIIPKLEYQSKYSLQLVTQIFEAMYISWANLTPIFDKYEQITYRQAAIDSSMPGKFKKCN